MRRRGRVSLSPIEMDDAVLEPIDSSDVDSDCVPLDSRERALIGTDSAQASFDCPLDSQKTSPTPSNCEADFCEAYLEHLWGPKRVAYFFRPNFSRSRNESVSRRKGTAAEPLYLGGYPTGMLRGARVPFRPDLKPWLVKPVVLPERAGRKLSLNQQLSTLSSHSGSLTPNERRLSDGSSLLESLRLHAGLNCGAKSVWEFLRSKSYELLVKLEQELDADMRATFDAFTRERVLRGEEKPPLCDFVRENHSNALSNTMRNLKAPRMEKQFRKLRAMVSWAERNQDQFRIAAFQHDLKDMLTDEEISKLVSEKLGKRPPIQPGFCVISQAEADQISGILPLVHIRQNLGPLERPKPALEDLFPGAILKKATGKSVHKQVDHMRSRRPGPKDAESIPQPDQLTSRFIYMRPSGRPHDKTRSFARSAESTPTGKPQTKDTLLKTSHHESRPIEIGDLNFPRRDSTVPPLCWAQLVDQYRRLRHKHSSIDGCLPTDLMETDFLGANALRQRYDLKRTSPSLWKPSAAVPT